MVQGPSRPERTRLTANQRSILQDAFDLSHYLSDDNVTELIEKAGLTRLHLLVPPSTSFFNIGTLANFY